MGDMPPRRTNQPGAFTVPSQLPPSSNERSSRLLAQHGEQLRDRHRPPVRQRKNIGRR